jgi:phosphatidylglycerol:prolipoprotein diacylglycerol transferase
MWPILFKIGSLEVKTWGVFVLLGFFIAILYTKREGKRIGIPESTVYDLAFLIVLASIVGARAGFVISYWNEFKVDIPSIFAVWEGGLAYFGGFALAVPVGFWYIIRKKLPVWKFSDIIAPGFSLGITVGRIGCLFNGCCFGTPTDLPFGISFPEGCSANATFGSASLHPTQIYEPLAQLALFVVLHSIRKRTPFPGFLFWLFIGASVLIRAGNDFFRYYEHTFTMGGYPLSYNRLVELAVLLLAVFMILFLRRRHLART